jgi:hypothetical protein
MSTEFDVIIKKHLGAKMDICKSLIYVTLFISLLASSANSDRTVDSLSSPGMFVWKNDINSIDYSNPELYLTLGSQSNLKEQYFNEINRQIRIENNDIEGIGMIFSWKQDYFKRYSAGGRFIGKITVNQIMKKNGFPAIMVDTAGIQWALDYHEGKRKGFRGHVFIEVYVKDKWILIDSTTGKYVENYDSSNPVIPMTHSVENKGYFVLFKGLDPRGYGITSCKQLNKHLKEFSRKIKSIEMYFPQYVTKRLPQ